MLESVEEKYHREHDPLPVPNQEFNPFSKHIQKFARNQTSTNQAIFEGALEQSSRHFLPVGDLRYEMFTFL